MPETVYKPNWSKHEAGMRADDEQVHDLAGEAFETERQHELATSKKARDWEKGRKEEWAKNKPEHVRKRDSINKDPSYKTLEQIKQGGEFDEEIIPSAGFILVEPDPVKKELHGIILPQSSSDQPNTGTVIEVGGEIVLESGRVIKPPAQKGDRVIFRKFVASIDLITNGKPCKFLQFSDILARIKYGKNTTL